MNYFDKIKININTNQINVNNDLMTKIAQLFDNNSIT